MMNRTQKKILNQFTLIIYKINIKKPYLKDDANTD